MRETHNSMSDNMIIRRFLVPRIDSPSTVLSGKGKKKSALINSDPNLRVKLLSNEARRIQLIGCVFGEPEFNSIMFVLKQPTCCLHPVR